MSDILLVEQCKQNNRKAQLALYEKYCDGMFIVAHRYMKDQAAAEDALQEAFIKAFKKLNQYGGEVSFGAWLKRIVINSCLDAIKANKMEKTEIDERTMEIQYDDNWEVSDESTVQEVVESIHNLKDPYGTVAKLFLLEGFDHQEISEVMEISETASRTYLHRAKKKIKDQLKYLKNGTGY